MDPYAYTKEERQLARLLSIIAFAAAILTIVSLAGISRGPSTTFFVEAPFASNTVTALGLLTLLAWIASADVRRFRAMVHLLTSGMAFGALAFIVLSFSPNGQAQRSSLAIGIMSLIVIVLLLGWFSLRARPASSAPIASPWIPEKPLTGWERFGQVLSVVVGLAALVATAGNLVLAFTGPPALVSFFRQPLMVGGSAVALGLLSACLLLAAVDIRHYNEMLMLFIVGSMVSVIAGLLALVGISVFGEKLITIDGVTVSTTSIMQIIVLVDAVAIVLFFLVRNRMSRALLNHLSFFNPFQFRALEGIAETLIAGGRLENVPPYQIALRTDSYLATIHATRTWLARLAVMGIDFSSLLWFKPPVSFLNPNLRREYFDRHFKRDILEPRGLLWVLDRFGPKIALDLLEGGMRFNMQLAYVGYYSDPRIHADIGYVPFSARPKDFLVHPVREYPPLDVMTPEVLNRRGIDTIHSADVVIIGTGAGGATLAEQLAKRGRDVLLLDRGAYVPPDEFSEDEVGMIGRLYRDGALQISQSLRFTILQGNAVGGTTVVNNAVCFDTPDRVLEVWNDPQGVNAGLDLADFKAAQKAVRQRMGIQSVLTSAKTRPGPEVLNPGDVVLQKGIDAVLPAQGFKYDVVEANIADCLGCGYCNIGCKYGRKLSMLDRVLPAAQVARGADKFQIMSETEAIRLRGRNGRIIEIEARVQGKRRLFIRNPKTVIVSAGTLASSWLLLQSGIGQGELPIGRWLCFNMGSPLHGWFDQRLNSYAGLQIGHYLELPEHPGFVYETWYNPPVAQALSMPGWLDTHFQNMQHYAEMAAVGVLVGTEPNPDTHLTRALFLPGSPDVVYTPTPRDLDTLATALVTLGKIMLAAGAKQIFASTRKYQSYSSIGAQKTGRAMAMYQSESDLDWLRDLIKTERDVLLGTGHPQGGNRISKNRGRNGVDGGVIDPGFKVYGYDNLYVCDASIHPTATTVNPQLTVMTFGRYAAERIDVK